MKDYQLTSDGLYAYRYPRASVTADAVLFAEKDGQMYVLLIQRGNDPYKGYWAFPGGFLNMDETVAHCAERELEEETGIVLTGMQLVGIYSDVERDPRGRVITAAYTAMTTRPEANSGRAFSGHHFAAAASSAALASGIVVIAVYAAVMTRPRGSRSTSE